MGETFNAVDPTELLHLDVLESFMTTKTYFDVPKLKDATTALYNHYKELFKQYRSLESEHEELNEMCLDQVEQLNDYFSKDTEDVEVQTDELEKETVQLNPEPIGSTNTSEFTENISQINANDLTKLIRETIITVEAIQERSCVAIIEKLPETDNENSTSSDMNIVREIASGIGVGQDLRLWKLRRCGKKVKDKCRNLRVYFNNTESRDTFLYSFRKSLSAFPNLPKNLAVRRDMSDDELAQHRALKKEAYEKNKDLGLLKFYVSDLTLKQISNPRLFIAH